MKKAAYDLGRKSVYFIVVAFYLAFMFAYAANMVMNYQEDTLQDLDRIDNGLLLPRATYCFALYDTELKHNSYGILELEKINEKTFKDCFKGVEFRMTLEKIGSINAMPEKIQIGQNPGESNRVFTKLVVVRSTEQKISSMYNLRVEV